MLTWPQVPEPVQDPNTHLDVLKALKQMVEMITGQRGGAPIPMVRVLITPIKPGASNSPYSVRQFQPGDLWIDTANSAKLKYWDVGTQVWIPTT